MRKKLTAAFCQKATAEPGRDRTYYWDTTKPGFGLMVTASGHRSFVVQYRTARRSSPRMKIKATSLDVAKREAAKILGQVADGADPLGDRRKKAIEAAGTFRSVAESYFKREGAKLRSLAQRRADFERLIYPKFGARPIGDIRRSDVVKLLDAIEEERGPVMADNTLAYLSKLFGWHAIRDDNFRSPIVRGMARTSSKERARSRILNDDELRRVWTTAETWEGPFGLFLQFVLLTGARRNEATQMTREELAGSTWLLPAARNKVKVDFVRPLSGAAQGVLAKLPKIGNCPYLFTVNGRTPIRGLAKFKSRFDRACGVSAWRIHDLRRTSRSLMSRAGVNADIAERCLGHVIPGVRGVYDRHTFAPEMTHAFEALATLIESVVHPRENVVPLRGGAS
jgi:integrase